MLNANHFFSKTALQFCWLIAFIGLPFMAMAQQPTIKYVNDALYINETAVPSNIKKSKLDKLVGSKSKKKKAKERNAKTGKKEKVTYLTYPDLGLVFKQNKAKPDVLHLSLYFQQADNSTLKYPLSNTFNGDLIIGNNTIKGKKSMDDLSKLDKVQLNILKVKVMDFEAIVSGDLIYQKNQIRCFFDEEKKEILYLTIYHGVPLGALEK